MAINFNKCFLLLLYFKNSLLIYLLLAMLGLCCFTGLSLFAASRGYVLAAVHGLLVAVASLAEHRLQSLQLLDSRTQAQ